jgi:hypothetical protein
MLVKKAQCAVTTHQIKNEAISPLSGASNTAPMGHNQTTRYAIGHDLSVAENGKVISSMKSN